MCTSTCMGLMCVLLPPVVNRLSELGRLELHYLLFSTTEEFTGEAHPLQRLLIIIILLYYILKYFKAVVRFL